MAREPDNLVLQLLREIRATQTEHSRLLAEHSRLHREHKQSFAELRDELRGVNNNAAYAAGFAVLGRRGNEETGQRVSAREARGKRIEERLE